jgi:hypothetical protein
MHSVVAAALVVVAAVPAATQSLQPFFPVGIVVGPPAGVVPDRRELQSLAKMRFNVIALSDTDGRDLRVVRLSALLDREPGRVPDAIPAAGLSLVSTWNSGREVRLSAWRNVAEGARGVLFAAGIVSPQNEGALAAAAEFADNVTRNAALFAPLRPRESAGGVRVNGERTTVEARILESNAALVVIAWNPGSDIQRVTLRFTDEFPEAIWQNMETGAAVNFVASPQGPIYTRTFTAFDVIVLMIRKQYR